MRTNNDWHSAHDPEMNLENQRNIMSVQNNRPKNNGSKKLLEPLTNVKSGADQYST